MKRRPQHMKVRERFYRGSSTQLCPQVNDANNSDANMLMLMVLLV